MPIYEFYCPDNHRIYSFFVRSLAYSDRIPRCPENPRFRMERMISKFAITGRAREKPETPAGGEGDDPRMSAIMDQMEQEFSDLDSENPDPKMLARMMRRVAALRGGELPKDVEEAMRRMEAGEDPEKLEEEFGSVFQDFDPLAGDQSAAGEEVRARLRALHRPPQRDPELYEMADYLDPEPAAKPRKTRKRPA